MTRGNIILDLDGTLIDSPSLYKKAGEEFNALVLSSLPPDTLSDEDVSQIRDATDAANSAFGWSRYRFPGSLGEAYMRIVGSMPYPHLQLNPLVLAQCVEIGFKVFRTKAPLLPNALPTVAALATSHDLYLYTKGDPDVQQKRISDLGVIHMFKDVGITPTKTSETLAAFLKIHHLDPASTWYVGDSMAEDIKPAVENGMRAVLVGKGSQYAWDQCHVDPDTYFPAADLAQMRYIIEKEEAVLFAGV
jgi:putative hydrolase of the HAD superfamily